MVRDPDRVGALVLQARGVVGAQHALDEERPVPGVAQPFHIIPVRRGAQQVADMRGGRGLERGVGIAVHQPHARHAVAERARRPGRAAHHLREKPGRQARRLGQARPGLALAAARHRDVDGQDKSGEPGILRPLEHVRADARIARRIHLEPAVLAEMRRHRLGRLGGDGGQPVGNVGLGGGGGEQSFGIGPEEARHADRRDAEGQGIGLAEHLDRQVGREFAMQDRGAEQNRIELRAIPGLRCLRPGGAFEIFPDEPRHPPPGAHPEVGDGGVA